jgi:hypothetical protein
MQRVLPVSQLLKSAFIQTLLGLVVNQNDYFDEQHRQNEADWQHSSEHEQPNLDRLVPVAQMHLLEKLLAFLSKPGFNRLAVV